jgi:type I restriction enzyme, R subunit
MGNPRFRKLSERLETLKERHEPANCTASSSSSPARPGPRAGRRRKEVPPEEDEDRGKAALTELFEEARTEDTPIIVERIVADIDEIVRYVRFPGWQNTSGRRARSQKGPAPDAVQVQAAQDTELFEKAYGYVREYYLVFQVLGF